MIIFDCFLHFRHCIFAIIFDAAAITADYASFAAAFAILFSPIFFAFSRFQMPFSF